jgi:hypothetical protein
LHAYVHGETDGKPEKNPVITVPKHNRVVNVNINAKEHVIVGPGSHKKFCPKCSYRNGTAAHNCKACQAPFNIGGPPVKLRQSQRVAAYTSAAPSVERATPRPNGKLVKLLAKQNKLMTQLLKVQGEIIGLSL